jgi:hypothetical protein
MLISTEGLSRIIAESSNVNYPMLGFGAFPSGLRLILCTIPDVGSGLKVALNEAAYSQGVR